MQHKHTPYVNRNLRRRRIELFFIDHRGDGTVDKVLPFNATLAPETEAVEPAISLTPEQATQLMDELWSQGVRPSGIGNVGELASTKYHLEDMRKLVFGKKE